MTDNATCPESKEVQDFLFKQASISQVCDELQAIPINPSLIAVDTKHGLLFIGHNNKIIIIKPGIDSNPEWKLDLDLPDKVSRVAISCDCSLLAVTFNQPSALIYDVNSIHKHKLDILHEIRLSTTPGQVYVSDLKWNPAIPEMLCSITSDHTIGCFQIGKDKKSGVQIIGMERPQGLEALCVSWSPKGKQLVVGCKNGDIVQLKPELKMARHLSGPTPNQGIIISLLWVSNYQFCACYFQASEKCISVMIVDAPKGVNVPKFTNYEDITYGSGSVQGLYYYFEYITEWGVIIAASSHSSEVAVLGTSDNGVTWNLYQLMDNSSVQLPLDRKNSTEYYPVGLAVDRSVTHKLPWGPEATLPNPVPVLRILVTSGQLCCYHIVNLKENVPAICTPPTEIVAAPIPQPRPSLGPSEVSFNLPTGATSTPRSKQIAPQMQPEKPKPVTNMFGTSAAPNFSFLPQNNKVVIDPTSQFQDKNTSFPGILETGTAGLFAQPSVKANLVQQENKVSKNLFMTPPEQSNKQPTQVYQQPPEIKTPGFPMKSHNKPELKIQTPSVLTQQLETKLTKESSKEPPSYHTDEVKSTIKETPVYDDALCLRAYSDEQNLFEKELKEKLNISNWNCGTEEERVLLVKKTEEIDEFLKELKETTNSLASDISYLKALLLQSFAWLEESRSRNSSSLGISGRGRSEGSKLTDLQRLYYYTQTQLIQATRVLDLEWDDYKNREISKMKIPNLEVIYQSLIRHNQIIAEEKKNIDDLTKKWRTLLRGGNNVTSLDRSMASLNISQSSNLPLNDTAIDLRCKLIASNTRNFSREKQAKLRDLLSESAPRVIKAARPTAVQDRLEATLSSLASLKTTDVKTKPKSVKSAGEQQKSEAAKIQIDQTKAKQQNPLSSLDNLVSGINSPMSGIAGLSKSPSSTAPFPTFGAKSPNATTTFMQAKTKENIPLSFGQSTTAQQSQVSGTTKSFGGKIESINFGTTSPKIPEAQVTRESFAKSNDASMNKFTMLPTNAFGKFGTSDNQTAIGVAAATTMTNISSVPKSTFSFSSSTSQSLSPPGFASAPKLDNAAFKFSTKPTSQQPPAAQGSLDLSSLSFGSRPGLSVTPASEAKTGTVANNPTASASFSFGKTSVTPQLTSLFGQSTGSATSQVAGIGKSATPPIAAISSLEKVAAVSSSTIASSQATTSSTAAATATITTAVPSSTFGMSSIFGGLSSSAVPNSTFSFAATPNQVTTTTATSSPAVNSFGGLATTSNSSTPSFGGLLGATASMSFGSTATGASISPAFSKNSVPSSTNIFGGTASTVPATATAPPSTNIFGGLASTVSATTAASPATTSIFGKSGSVSTPAPTAAASSTASSIFGKSGGASAPISTASPFGTTSTTTASTTTAASAATTTSVFGTAATPSSSIFGAQSPTTSSTENSFFGGAKSPTSTVAATTAASVFGGSGTTTTAGGSIFGSSGVTTSVFSSTGATTQPSNVFGTPSTTQSSGTSIFGGAAAAAPSSGSVFGGTGSAVFGPTPTTTATSTASVFGGAASTATSSIFGGSSATPGSSVFGASTTPSSSIFGTAAATTTATATPSGSVFGAASPGTGNVFVATPGSPNASGSVFGGPPVIGGGSMFGGGASPGMGSSMFGQSAAFGAKPVFGSPTQPASTFGSGFGSSPAFGGGASPGFGSPPAFGTAAISSSNTSPTAVFGSNTFETLGTQSGGLSFGSLAQNTPEPAKPQASFQGSTSFSSWR